MGVCKWLNGMKLWYNLKTEVLNFQSYNESMKAMEKKKRVVLSEEQKQQKGRRSFLKKTVYAAPTLIVLGQLTKPSSVKAGFGGPPSDPGGWG